MQTPILDGLNAHLAHERASFHMPGHKGRMQPLNAAYDVTEVFDTGDLFSGGDFIEEAEKLWAESWGMKCGQFLTGGSTQGIHAALLLCRRRGAEILVDRGCHRSVYNALGLFDYHPHYLLRTQEEPVTVAALERTLDGTAVTTVCITSPTYYGVMSDIPALAAWCGARDIQLVVDGAHGAHLPFLRGENPFAPAGLVITSAHKTLPVYGQGAVLLAGRDSGFSPADLRWACSVTGSSSPSYPILLSMDAARAYFTTPAGRAALEGTAAWAEKFRRRFPSLSGAEVDPMRFVLRAAPETCDGFRVQEKLEAEGIVPEMADVGHVVFLFSPNNTEEDYRLLWNALERLEQTGALPPRGDAAGSVTQTSTQTAPNAGSATQTSTQTAPNAGFAPQTNAQTAPDAGFAPQKPGFSGENPAQSGWEGGFSGAKWLPPEPEVVLNPRQALLSARKPGGSVWESVGKIAAQPVAPYPPGIPIIAPGERITEKTIAFLREIGYNDKKPMDLISLSE